MNTSVQTTTSASSDGVGNNSRLVALDAFRGAVILLMVLVNNGGPGAYAQLEHSEWNGWTLTDTVFPSFLWIVGVAITLSLGKRLTGGATPASLVPQILRRGITIYLLGFFLYMIPEFDFSHARFLGVLQRIGICYLIAALIYLYTGMRTQLVIIAVLFALYTGLMLYGPVPGYGHGFLDMERNFSHYIDSIVLGPHNYAHTKTWDPEGIVSTLPAIVTPLLGIMAGYVLRLKTPLTQRITRMILIGAALIATAELWNQWMPINKKIWSCAFVLLMAGLDFVVLAAALWVMDELRHHRIFKPFVIVGMNSIAVYLASELLAVGLDSFEIHGASVHDLLYSRYYVPLGSPANVSLLWSLSFVAAMYLVAYLLYRKRWFWRI